MKYLLIFISAILYVSCGGSGASSDSQKITYEGKAVDGYLNKATVFLDLNNNLQLDSTEPSTTTNYSGSYTLEVDKNIDISDATLVVIGGYDIDTDEKFTGILKTSVNLKDKNGKLNISPISSVLKEYLDDGIELTQAKEKVANIFGISSSDIAKDPVKEFTNNPKLYKENIKLVKLFKELKKENGFKLFEDKELMSKLFKNIKTNDTALTDLSAFTFEGSVYNIDKLRAKVDSDIQLQEPTLPDDKYKNIKVPNLLVDINATEFRNLNNTYSTYGSRTPNYVTNAKTLNANYTWFNFLDNIESSVTSIPKEITHVFNINSQDRTFFYKEENDDTITKYRMKTGSDNRNYIIKNITNKNTGTSEDITLDTVSWDNNRYLGTYIRSGIKINDKYLLVSFIETIAGTRKSESKTAVLNLENFEVVPLKDTSGNTMTLVPLFINNNKIIASNKITVDSTYAYNERLGVYDYKIQNDTVVITTLDNAFASVQKKIQMINEVYYSDYDNDGKYEIVIRQNGGTGNSTTYEYYCNMEEDTFKPCFNGFTMNFIQQNDNKYLTFDISRSGIYRHYYASIYQYDGEEIKKVGESKRVTPSNSILATNILNYFKEPNIVAYATSADSKYKKIVNFDFDTYIEDIEEMPSNSANMCASTYPGDLKNEPQLVGQCQVAYFYDCNKKAFESTYPEKIPEFNRRIKSYCDILDGYKNFTKDGSNPKDKCTVCKEY